MYSRLDILRWVAPFWRLRGLPWTTWTVKVSQTHNKWTKMLAHTFRGSSIRSALGLESEKKVFERYRAIRRTEREFM